MSTIQFQTGGLTGTGYLAIPHSSKGRGVVVLHAWWGLNDFFKRLCDRLAGEGFASFAPDLHQGRTASTIDAAKELMAKRDLKAIMRIVTGAVELLRSHPAVDGGKVGVIGFSMGGAWSLWLSTQKPEDVGAVVVFYGTAGDYIDEADFAKSQAAFLGHYAETDEWEPTEGVKKLEEFLRGAGKHVEFHFYPGVRHWFFEEDWPEYDPKPAGLAWKRTIQLLNYNLR